MCSRPDTFMRKNWSKLFMEQMNIANKANFSWSEHSEWILIKKGNRSRKKKKQLPLSELLGNNLCYFKKFKLNSNLLSNNKHLKGQKFDKLCWTSSNCAEPLRYRQMSPRKDSNNSYHFPILLLKVYHKGKIFFLKKGRAEDNNLQSSFKLLTAVLEN